MIDSEASAEPFRNSTLDWAARTVIFVIFLYFGAGKFTSDPDAPWVVLFSQVGFGQGLRYFTGVSEIIGAFLVLIPQTVTAGVAVLAATLAGAVLVVVILLHRPPDAFWAFAFLCALIAFWLHRRRA
jgi:putative oxidoreductase